MSERPTPQAFARKCQLLAQHTSTFGQLVDAIHGRDAEIFAKERADADRRVAEERERVRAVLQDHADDWRSHGNDVAAIDVEDIMRGLGLGVGEDE